jgi:hypothetical protein
MAWLWCALFDGTARCERLSVRERENKAGPPNTRPPAHHHHQSSVQVQSSFIIHHHHHHHHLTVQIHFRSKANRFFLKKKKKIYLKLKFALNLIIYFFLWLPRVLRVKEI